MGKFVYKNKECMDKMHEFYDKALNLDILVRQSRLSSID